MKYEEIYLDVVDNLSKKLNITKDKIKNDSIFMEDIKIDSLQLLLFVGHYENKYGIEFDEEKLLEVKTVEDFCRLIEQTNQMQTDK